jgi:hypothetical protein
VGAGALAPKVLEIPWGVRPRTNQSQIKGKQREGKGRQRKAKEGWKAKGRQRKAKEGWKAKGRQRKAKEGKGRLD